MAFRILLGAVILLALYIAVAMLKGRKFSLPSRSESSSGSSRGLRLGLLAAAVFGAILMLNIGWWTAPEPPEVVVKEPLIHSVEVRTDRFSGFYVPEGWAFRYPDVEEVTKVRFFHKDGTIGEGYDFPNRFEVPDQGTFPGKAVVRVEFISTQPQGEGFSLEPITWFRCGAENEPPCF